MCTEETGNGKIAEYAARLYRQSLRLKKLIENMVEASKASTGSLEVELVPCEVDVMLVQALGEYEKRLEEKRLELIIRQPGIPVKVLADTRHLRKVFDHLMSNVCNYSQPGTRVYLSVEVSMANVSMANVSMANVSMPNASMPNASVANVSMPNASVTNVSMPNASVTNVSVANVSMPNASVANVSMPNASMPNAPMANVFKKNVSMANAFLANVFKKNVSMANAFLANVFKKNASTTNASVANVAMADVAIVFMNVSRSPLDITGEEFMERFAGEERGRQEQEDGPEDGARLGLSITRSLTELMNGKFEVSIDGDLFKVSLVFKGIQ
jgi:K+-sensing histidine kinase KdpD